MQTSTMQHASAFKGSVQARVSGLARLHPSAKRTVSVQAGRVPQQQQQDEPATRRQVLLSTGLAVAGAAVAQLPVAQAAVDAPADAPYSTFLGYATPPTSYGGYGGNANEAPRYTFEYPTGWKAEIPSKVEKGTQGIDGRVVNPRVKGQRAFVITLSRAGEDNMTFRLTDLDSTFQGFAGADYDLQDALSNASEINKESRETDGNLFYLYDIDSPEVRYLSSISVKNGKVFALFVKTPAKNFKSSEAKLRHIVDTFRLL